MAGRQEAGGYSTDAWSQAVWGADQDALNAGGYNSKYQLDRPEEVAPNVFRLVVQQPGMHKYDTAEVYYRVDPETGMGVMVDDPTATRQTSSKDKWQDRLEQRILPLIATVLTAGYGAEALAGMGAGGGAGAGAAEAGAGALMDYGVGPRGGASMAALRQDWGAGRRRWCRLLRRRFCRGRRGRRRWRTSRCRSTVRSRRTVKRHFSDAAATRRRGARCRIVAGSRADNDYEE
ncbi:MAG: hypothetical protein IPI51_07385 [Betaproteobacteria bacterium]|nr:hypothetical protein [Betaproteobacteria bacterium]